MINAKLSLNVTSSSPFPSPDQLCSLLSPGENNLAHTCWLHVLQDLPGCKTLLCLFCGRSVFQWLMLHIYSSVWKASVQSTTGQGDHTRNRIKIRKEEQYLLLLLNNLSPTSKFSQGSFCIFLTLESTWIPPLPSKNCNDSYFSPSTDFCYTCVLLGWPAGTRDIKSVMQLVTYFLLCAYDTSQDFYTESNAAARQEWAPINLIAKTSKCG